MKVVNFRIKTTEGIEIWNKAKELSQIMEQYTTFADFILESLKEKIQRLEEK